MNNLYFEDTENISVDDMLNVLDKTVLINRKPINRFENKTAMISYYLEALSLAVVVDYLIKVKHKSIISINDLTNIFNKYNYNLDNMETLVSKNTNCRYLYNTYKEFVDGFKEKEFLKKMTRLNLKNDLIGR